MPLQIKEACSITEESPILGRIHVFEGIFGCISPAVRLLIFWAIKPLALLPLRLLFKR